MKKIIIVIVMILGSYLNAMSEASDSASIAPNFLKSNEVGISIDNMNNIFGSDGGFSLSYKHRFNLYSLRLGIYNNDKRSIHSENNYKFLNDTLYTLSQNELSFYDIGVRIGFEKDNYINDNLYFFYGIDLNCAYLKEVLHTSTEVYKSAMAIEPYIDLETESQLKKNGNNDIYYGFNIGANPVIGITQSYTPYFSTTFELGIFMYYSKVQQKPSSMVMDEILKLTANFDF